MSRILKEILSWFLNANNVVFSNDFVFKKKDHDVVLEAHDIVLQDVQVLTTFRLSVCESRYVVDVKRIFEIMFLRRRSKL